MYIQCTVFYVYTLHNSLGDGCILCACVYIDRYNVLYLGTEEETRLRELSSSSSPWQTVTTSQAGQTVTLLFSPT